MAVDSFYKNYSDLPVLRESLMDLLQINTGHCQTIVQRSVLRRVGTERIEHGITLFVGKHFTEKVGSDRELDYGDLILVEEVLQRDAFEKRTEIIARGWLPTKQFCFRLPDQVGINERYYGSRNDYSVWPGKLFEISGPKPNLSYGPLLASKGLPFYKDSFAAIKSFLELSPFHNDYDSRLGETMFFLPNCRAKLDHLQLVNPTRLIVNLYLALDKTRTQLHVEARGDDYEETITLDADHSLFVDFKKPISNLTMWLYSDELGIQDLYDESPFYVNGGKWPGVLPKAKPTGLAPAQPMIQSSPGSFTGVTASPNTDTQHFFASGTHHDAYVKIREIVNAAQKEITIVDGYVDGTLFTLLTNIANSVKIRILTNQVKSDFLLEAKKFQKQYGGSIDVRTTNTYHDRFIIIDGNYAWHLGASIKDAGAKAFLISELRDVAAKNARQDIEVEWANASVIYTS